MAYFWDDKTEFFRRNLKDVQDKLELLYWAARVHNVKLRYGADFTNKIRDLLTELQTLNRKLQSAKIKKDTFKDDF